MDGEQRMANESNRGNRGFRAWLESTLLMFGTPSVAGAPKSEHASLDRGGREEQDRARLFDEAPFGHHYVAGAHTCESILALNHDALLLLRNECDRLLQMADRLPGLAEGGINTINVQGSPSTLRIKVIHLHTDFDRLPVPGCEKSLPHGTLNPEHIVG